MSMTTVLRGIALGMAVLPGVTGAAWARDDARVLRKELQAKYDRFYPVARAAVATKDVAPARAFLDSIYTPDFVLTFSDGTRETRSQNYKRLLGAVPAIQAIEKYETRIVGIDMKRKGVCTVDTRWVTSMRSPSPLKPGPDMHLVTFTANGRDTWVKTAGGWRIRRSAELKGDGFIDGKLITPAAWADAEIQALNDELAQAFRDSVGTKQYARLRTIAQSQSTPDMMFRSVAGDRRTGKQWLDAYIQWASSMQELHRYDVRNLRTTLRGGKTADVTIAIVSDYEAVDPATLEIHRKGMKSTETLRWVKTPSGWKCSKEVELQVRSFTDGKPDGPIRRNAKPAT